jgi:sialate O-acetylesterase
MRNLFALLTLCLFACGARADVRLHALFADHAVLQRDRPLPVWGWMAAGEPPWRRSLCPLNRSR